MTDVTATKSRATKPFDPPETCPSCGATLQNVGPVGNTCPHCGYDLESQPAGFGQREQERRHAQERQQGGPVR